MRISRALALAGIGSRRQCEVHVQNGAVTLNGETVFDLGRQVNLDEDTLTFRGKPLSFGRHVYYLIHKPVGYTTTASDPHAKKTVFDLLPPNLISGSRQARPDRTRVFPVGRLDKDSSGLLLFTNDGDLANRLMHPRFEVVKCYDVRLDRALEIPDERKLLKGIRLEEGMARIAKIRRLSRRILRLEIREGKKREIRRMFEALGYEVIDLMRIAFGPLTLGALTVGRGRYLTAPEIQNLKATGHKRTH